MNNWIQNIKGQITDLATEVLHEARDEIEDPESELQVLLILAPFCCCKNRYSIALLILRS